MAIKVSNTIVIDDSRNLVNVFGLKTVNGASILGSGDIPVDVTGQLITGFVSGTGVVAATDTILQAVNKLDGNVGTKQTSVAPSTSGNLLTSNGSAWVSQAPGASGATITDDNATSSTQYLGMSRITTGAWTAAYVASTKLTFNPSTGILNSVVFNSLSDESKKTNIKTIYSGVEVLGKLRGVEFNWKDTGLKASGVIAQEVETVLPFLVNEEAGVKSVNYSGLIGYLIEANKELLSRIEMLENKV